MSDYLIPETEITVEQYVKKSQFICHLTRSANREEAMDFIRRISTEHSGANHNCWAFIAGPPGDASCWGMNDDGEPKGCAGKPMFNVLHHHGAGEICAVVTRYFGGIKLGTGGMARAYSSTVKLALDEMRFVIRIEYRRFILTYPYDMQKNVDHFVNASKGRVISTDYGEMILSEIDIPTKNDADFLEQMKQLGKSRVRVSAP